MTGPSGFAHGKLTFMPSSRRLGPRRLPIEVHQRVRRARIATVARRSPSLGWAVVVFAALVGCGGGSARSVAPGPVREGGDARDLERAAQASALRKEIEIWERSRVPGERARASQSIVELAEHFTGVAMTVAIDGVSPDEAAGIRATMPANEWPLARIALWGSAVATIFFLERGQVDTTTRGPEVRYAAGTLTLTFAAKPGKTLRTRAVRVVERRGDDVGLVEPPSERTALEALASVPPGSVAKRSIILERRDAIEAHLKNAGYYETSASTDFLSHDDSTCTVTFTVVRGSKRAFAEPIVSVLPGGSAPLEARLRAAIAIAPGRTYDERAVLEARTRVASLSGVEDVAVSSKLVDDGRVQVTFEVRAAPTAK